MRSRSALPGRPSSVGRGGPSETDRSQQWHPTAPVSRQARSRTKRQPTSSLFRGERVWWFPLSFFERGSRNLSGRCEGKRVVVTVAEEQELLSPQQAADWLGCSRQHVERLANAGELEARKVRGRAAGRSRSRRCWRSRHAASRRTRWRTSSPGRSTRWVLRLSEKESGGAGAAGPDELERDRATGLSAGSPIRFRRDDRLA